MKVLVIEDEVRSAEYLAKGLAESGYSVDTVHDGLDGIHWFHEGEYDAVILDVMLPGADGWTVMKAIRNARATPVIFLTACDSVADRFRAFELGAEDYLVKPFAFAELLARLRRCLRQVRQQTGERLQRRPWRQRRLPLPMPQRAAPTSSTSYWRRDRAWK
ncbi:response regulator [Burkholderia cepacia]|uniref:response regulator n=1 Tax=Burkholderia cepacia TaxID=292 RepID=UPI0006866CC4|nr:response regulator [Burkholderia cepacia]